MVKSGALILVVAAALASALPAAAQDRAERSAFGEMLCTGALEGEFGALDTREIKAAQLAAQASTAALCACTGYRYGYGTADDHLKVVKEHQAAFKTARNYYQQVSDRMWFCLDEIAEPSQMGIDWEGQVAEVVEEVDLGESYVSHVLQCEGILGDTEPLMGRSIKSLRAALGQAGLSVEQACGCSGDYYLEHLDEMLTEMEAVPEDETIYPQLMLASLDACIASGGVYPDLSAQSDPAYDPDPVFGAMCNAIARGELDVAAFDHAEQARWEAGSGLTAYDMCGCVEAMLLDEVAEEDLHAADDIEALMLGHVLTTIPSCRDAMWRG